MLLLLLLEIIITYHKVMFNTQLKLLLILKELGHLIMKNHKM